MNRLKEWWAELPPDKKRLVSGGGGGIAGLLILYLFMSAGPEVEVLPEDLPTDTSNILTGVAPRELGIEALGNRVQANEAALQAVQAQITALGETGETSAQTVLERIEGLAEQVGALNTNVEQVRSEQQQQRLVIPQQVEARVGETEQSDTEIQQPGTVGPQEIMEQNLFDVSRPQGLVEPNAFDAPVVDGGSTAIGTTPASAVRVLWGDVANGDRALANPDTVYLPAGSIISGVLLTGVDVPTGQLAQSDPLPALMRVKHEAILPNRYRSDVKECFIIVAAQGDLSSERALMRSESLTCIRMDGRIIEVAIDGWAVGDDGKLGLRGRLVSRNGQVVAKAAAAGFAQAMSQIYRPVGVQAFNTTPGIQHDLSGARVKRGAERERIRRSGRGRGAAGGLLHEPGGRDRAGRGGRRRPAGRPGAAGGRVAGDPGCMSACSGTMRSRRLQGPSWDGLSDTRYRSA